MFSIRIAFPGGTGWGLEQSLSRGRWQLRKLRIVGAKVCQALEHCIVSPAWLAQGRATGALFPGRPCYLGSELSPGASSEPTLFWSVSLTRVERAAGPAIALSFFPPTSRAATSAVGLLGVPVSPGGCHAAGGGSEVCHLVLVLGKGTDRLHHLCTSYNVVLLIAPCSSQYQYEVGCEMRHAD